MANISTKQSALIVFVKLSLYGVFLVVNLILAKELGHELYGDYSVTQSVIFILVPLVLLGIDKTIITYLPSAPIEKKADHYEINTNLLKWARKRLLATAALLMGLWFIMLAGVLLFNLFNINFDHHHSVYFLWISIAVAISFYLNTIFHSLRLFGYAIFFYTMGSIVNLGIVVLLNVLDVIKLNNALLGFALANLLVIISQIFVLRKNYKFISLAGGIDPETAAWSKSANTFARISFLYIKIYSIILIYVEMFGHSEVITGNLNITFVIGNIPFIIADTINFILEPSLGIKYQPKISEIKHLVNKLNLIKVGILLLSLVLFFSLTEYYPDLLGKETGNLLFYLKVQLIFNSLLALMYCAVPLLQFTGHETLCGRLQFLTLIFVALASIPLVIYYQYNGALIACNIANTLNLGLYTYFSYKKTTINAIYNKSIAT